MAAVGGESPEPVVVPEGPQEAAPAAPMPEVAPAHIAGMPVTVGSSGEGVGPAALVLGAAEEPLEAAGAAARAAAHGAGMPHAGALPDSIPPDALGAGFEGVKAKAAKSKQKPPEYPSAIEIATQDYINDVIDDMSGTRPGYPYMLVKERGMLYRVEQRGDRMIIMGPGAQYPEQMKWVLREVQKENDKRPEGPVFDPKDLELFLESTEAQKNLFSVTPAEQQEAEQMAQQILEESGFFTGVGSQMHDPEKLKTIKEGAFQRMRISRAVNPAIARSFPGVPGQRSVVPDDVRSAFAIMTHEHVLNKRRKKHAEG